MPHGKRTVIDFPLELEPGMHVMGFTDNRDIQIRLPKGAFIHAKGFLHALENGRPGQALNQGSWVTIRVLRVRDLEVKIRLRSGGSVTRRFDEELCDEIAERISQISAALHTYAPDKNAMASAERRRLEARDRRTKAA